MYRWESGCICIGLNPGKIRPSGYFRSFGTQSAPTCILDSELTTLKSVSLTDSSIGAAFRRNELCEIYLLIALYGRAASLSRSMCCLKKKYVPADRTFNISILLIKGKVLDSACFFMYLIIRSRDSYPVSPVHKYLKEMYTKPRRAPPPHDGCCAFCCKIHLENCSGRPI